MVKFLRSRGKLYEVFEPSFDCKYCYGDNFIEQKLNYIHNNPVKSKWQLAESAVEYLHSSAYFTFTPKGSKQFMKLHRINGLENEWIKLYTQSAFQDTLLRRKLHPATFYFYFTLLNFASCVLLYLFTVRIPSLME